MSEPKKDIIDVDAELERELKEADRVIEEETRASDSEIAAAISPADELARDEEARMRVEEIREEYGSHDEDRGAGHAADHGGGHGHEKKGPATAATYVGAGASGLFAGLRSAASWPFRAAEEKMGEHAPDWAKKMADWIAGEKRYTGKGGGKKSGGGGSHGGGHGDPH
jgi:hypothetical protein